MGLLKSWGIGARLVFEAGKAREEMDTTQGKAKQTKRALAEMGKGAREAGAGMTQLWMSLVPVGIAATAAIVKGSQLAAEMEGNILTMRILIGDSATAMRLLQDLREEAARTPFEESDLIGASKVLLSVTKGNVAETRRLLKMSETMAALEPSKTVRDAAMALQDAMQGSGIERLVEFPDLSIRAEDLGEAAGKRGGAAWAKAMANEVEARLNNLTKGEDLVGALSRTFAGRASTLRDNISGVLRDVGTAVNQAFLGPMVDSGILLVQELAPVIRDGFGMVLAGITSFRDSLAPTFAWLRGMWDSVGAETKARVFSWITWFGLFAAVMVPVGGAILGLATAAMGLGTALFASWGAITAFMTFVGTVGLPLIGAMALEFAQLAAVVAVLGYLGGDSWFTALAQAGRAAWYVLSTVAAVLWEVTAGLVQGLWAGLQPAIELLRPAFAELVTALGNVFGELQGTVGGASLLGRIAYWLGETIGWLTTFVLVPAVTILAALINVATGAAQAIAPLVQWVMKLGAAFFGVLDGSLSLREALGLVLLSTAEGAIRIVRTIAQTLLQVVAGMIRGVANLVAQVPGMGWAANFLRRGAGAVEGAEGVGLARGAFGETLNALEMGQSRIERARAARMSPTVNVKAGETNVQVELESKTTLDGREVARSQGRAAVKDGERGKGPRVAPTRMGRVLRGSTVGALRPAEAVAGG